jgi:hypothetical protein
MDEILDEIMDGSNKMDDSMHVFKRCLMLVRITCNLYYFPNYKKSNPDTNVDVHKHNIPCLDAKVGGPILEQGL